LENCGVHRGFASEIPLAEGNSVLLKDPRAIDDETGNREDGTRFKNDPLARETETRGREERREKGTISAISLSVSCHQSCEGGSRLHPSLARWKER